MIIFNLKNGLNIPKYFSYIFVILLLVMAIYCGLHSVSEIKYLSLNKILTMLQNAWIAWNNWISVSKYVWKQVVFCIQRTIYHKPKANDFMECLSILNMNYFESTKAPVIQKLLNFNENSINKLSINYTTIAVIKWHLMDSYLQTILALGMIHGIGACNRVMFQPLITAKNTIAVN